MLTDSHTDNELCFFFVGADLSSPAQGFYEGKYACFLFFFIHLTDFFVTCTD